MTWMYNGKSLTEAPEGYYGFVYLIIDMANDKAYIGKKYFHSRRTLPPLKGKKRRRKTITESDWRTYCSSSPELKEQIDSHGLDHFKRLILSIHKTKYGVDYGEIEEQFKRNVLYTRNEDGELFYYNKNIAGRYHFNAAIAEEQNNFPQEIA